MVPRGKSSALEVLIGERAGSSSSRYGPACDLPSLSPAAVCSPSKLAEWQRHQPGKKYHRRNSSTGVNLIKPPPLVYFNIALVTEIIKMDSANSLVLSPFN